MGRPFLSFPGKEESILSCPDLEFFIPFKQQNASQAANLIEIIKEFP